MTHIETKIITLIQENSFLSQELKDKYILALFLMHSNEQEAYLQLIEAFTYRCNAINRDIYRVAPEEKQQIMKTLEEVKQDILKKINTKY